MHNSKNQIPEIHPASDSLEKKTHRSKPYMFVRENRRTLPQEHQLMLSTISGLKWTEPDNIRHNTVNSQTRTISRTSPEYIAYITKHWVVPVTLFPVQNPPMQQLECPVKREPV